jgi:JmjC domain
MNPYTNRAVPAAMTALSDITEATIHRASGVLDRHLCDVGNGRLKAPFSFTDLLAPVTLEAYCAQHWAARPLHLVRRSTGFYDALISLPELERLFAIDGFFSQHLATTPERGVGVPEPPPSSVSQAYERLAGGASLRLRNLETVLDPGRPIMVLLRDIARALGHPYESLSCYVAPTGARGLGPHHDETEIFTLQIAGSKRWRLYQRVSSPLPALHDAKSLGEPAEDFVLEAGDLLYVPSGWVHDVTAKRSSFSMTLVFRPARWSALLDLLTTRLALHPDFVAPLPAGAGGSERAADLEAMLGRRIDVIARALEQTNPADVLSAVARDAVVAAGPSPEPHLETLSRTDEIDSETVLVRRPGVLVHVQTGAESVQLTFSGGYFLRMHAAAAPALQGVVHADGPFRVADMPGELSAAAKVALARRLVVAGLLSLPASGRTADG